MQLNSIAQRLSMLSDQWASFTEQARARVLCWQLTADECSMFEAFIELESDERTAEHATLFEQTVPLAAAAQDGGGMLDCHRLASFCYEQNGDAARAWQAALLSLAAAQQLEPSARESSNLASLAVALRRMAAHHPARSVEPVLEQLAQLLGSKDQPAAVSHS
jgi:uncharacterized protein YaeQ